ncbi:helicase-related protein [Streptomyces millisiae]|uniref:Helicase-related protein n=1 Tax=Streptomyces millisiae TaxID=3075542 RepID=A0ABU2LVE3_9ACTN|nr:helicase-related protein [Streptomyces sp. DSM 44918]MDT0321557.1 helicase-related protein [Streptomyces sp. DSM 44918]
MSPLFTPGDLVSARGRDWVVLPGTTEHGILARPLDGDAEYDTLILPAERPRPSGFAAPRLPERHSTTTPQGTDAIGDFASAQLLRTALRVTATSSAGPFRSLSGIAVQPRQYQLVPLMLALRMETVRLLIGDDVGIGKTVEAALIAKELLEQGTVTRLSVLCSPALAEQWQRELRDKFGLDAQLVLPSTAERLQRGIEDDVSLFTRYPYTVVSTDFIKQSTRRGVFLRTCPELLIVDEAHGCVGTGPGHQQRYELLKALAEDPTRHLILVTATPHSGERTAFAKLTGLLNPELATLDPTIPGHRDRLARHLVQRRRRDVRSFLGEDTPFPEDRELREVEYRLDEPYRRFVADVITFARTQVRHSNGELRQRMSWWSALALLRCVLSSPEAGHATLTTRAAVADAHTTEEADRLGREEIYELADDESLEGVDAIPGTALDDDTAPETATRADAAHRAALRAFARRAKDLADPAHDAKLRLLIEEVRALLVDGYDPIVFCRYIPTATYVQRHLAKALERRAQVTAVTGLMPPEAREDVIAELATRPGRQVLVATDCLSEGVNLQERFGAVLHYDLSWNPTRHEQREGRVDRFGQRRRRVRAVTLYTPDTGIDGTVLSVLIRKHRAIADQTGVALPVPKETAEGVVRALTESLLLHGHQAPDQLSFDFGSDAALGAARDQLHREWESAAARESKVPTKFAHSALDPEQVRRELDAVRQALGEPGDIAHFTQEALTAVGAAVRPGTSGFTIQPRTLPPGLRHSLGYFETDDQAAAAATTGRRAPTQATTRGGRSKGGKTRSKTPAGTPDELAFRPDLPVAPGEAALVRTDPAVRAIARYVLDSALDPTVPDRDRPARRLGVLRTSAVPRRTVLLLVRFRFRLTIPGKSTASAKEMVAEDPRVLAWRREETGELHWLDDEATARLLAAVPDSNTNPHLRESQMRRALDELDRPEVRDHLTATSGQLAEQLTTAHQRVRQAAGERGRNLGAAAARRITVTPSGDPDLLGVYVYLPHAAASLDHTADRGATR